MAFGTRAKVKLLVGDPVANTKLNDFIDGLLDTATASINAMIAEAGGTAGFSTVPDIINEAANFEAAAFFFERQNPLTTGDNSDQRDDHQWHMRAEKMVLSFIKGQASDGGDHLVSTLMQLSRTHAPDEDRNRTEIT